MPIGVNEWRAGISKCRALIIKRDDCKLPVTEMVLQTLGCLAYLYLFMWILVFTAPLSGVVVWLWSHFVPMTSESPSTIYVLSHLNSFSLIHLHLLFNYLLDTLNSVIDKVHVQKLIFIVQNIVYTMLISICLENLRLGSGYPLSILLFLLSGDIHVFLQSVIVVYPFRITNKSSCTAHSITPFVWISLASSLTSQESLSLASMIDPIFNILLYGSPRCSVIENSIILESTISYIKDTGRFD